MYIVVFRVLIHCKSLPKFLHFHFSFNNMILAKIRSFVKSLNFQLKFSTNMKSVNIHKTQKHQLFVRITLNPVQVAYSGDSCFVPEHIAVTQSWPLRLMEANLAHSSEAVTFAANRISGLHRSVNVVISYSLQNFKT
jgi:hypothetical protein